MPAYTPGGAEILPTTAGDVALKVEFEDYEKGIDAGRGPWVRVSYIIEPWAAANAVVNALMGVGFTPGHTCPFSPQLRCTDAVARGIGEAGVDAAGQPTYALARVSATYGILQWDAAASDDPTGQMGFPNEINPGQPYLYMESSIDFASEVLTIGEKRRFYKFADGKEGPPAARRVATATFTLVRHWQRKLPYADFATYLCGINDAVFLGQPRGTIMFLNGRTRRRAMSDGSKAQEVVLNFKWREFDHNKLHRPDKFSFEYVTDPDGNKMYTYRDLTNLLGRDGYPDEGGS